MSKSLTATLLFSILITGAHAQTAGDKEMLDRGKQRDQQAIDEAIHGWWTSSMKSHDQRIAWWRDARFGMFIHWGVYSRAGGEWKGRKVDGYAEHLMRKEKISRKEYLELAHGFNPVKFNAERWPMQNAPGLSVETSAQSPIDLPKVMTGIEHQTHVLLDNIRSATSVSTSGSAAASASAAQTDTTAFSPRTIENGKLKLVASRDWTCGFFPGELWMLYGYTHNEAWRQEAQRFTTHMEREKTNATTHDMGFKIFDSYGTAYRLTKDPAYKAIIIQSARTLSTRFHPRIGCIRSWDHHHNLWGFPVIIDNMMNLELLFEATRLTGDSSFYKIAVSHANTTMKNHFRPDYSSFHVVDYDTVTGAVVKKMTWQGANDSSAWARGQAWGLYAYTMCYRYTKNPVYLRQADHIAAFILHHPNLPPDKVPYWDFNAPGLSAPGIPRTSAAPDTIPRDASAAAIIASGLYELSTYSRQGVAYRAAADAILESLTGHYRAEPGTHEGFILLHSTGGRPSNTEVDVPLNYADYYYIEALLRSRSPGALPK